MGNREIKMDIINDLKNRDVFTQQVSNIEIRTRCPFCGDTDHNFNTGHLYLRINPNDNLPIVYNCFRCPAQGVLKYEDLELLGLFDNKYKEKIFLLNRTSDKVSRDYSESKDVYFEYELPRRYDLEKISYVENRLGIYFSEEDFQNMKIITSLREFLVINKIDTITCKKSMANYVEKNYVGFLSNNNSYILFRDITDKSKIRWYKYPITRESQGQKIFYSMKSQVDIYTNDDIVINMSEGVFDCLGVNYHIYNNQSSNILNIAVCGKFYNKVIKHLFSLGLVGDNVTINIYADNDGKEDTSIEYYSRILKKYSYLVKELNVYHNLKDKDYGVKKDKIILNKNKI